MSADSDTAKLQELVLASIPKEVAAGLKDAKELAAVVKSQGEMLLQHAEIIRILRGTAMEQDNRVKAALVKINLTAEATDKLADAVELVEADQAAVVSDFKELKAKVVEMQGIIETKEVEQDAKLLRLVEQRHIDVNALTAEIQEKMARVEATFVQVEGLMFTLKQCQTETQTSAGPVPAAALLELTQLKQRADAASRSIAQNAECIRDVKQAVNDVDEKLVSMETNLQGSVAHVTEFVVQTTTQAAENMARVVAEREHVICTQFETAIAEVGKGACRCPGNCPGAAAGGRQQPPSIAAQQSATGAAARAPFLGGGIFNLGGGSGGGGPPRGPPGGGDPSRGHPGGGFGPGSSAAHDIFSDDGQHQHRKLLKSSKSPFDSKAAKDELPRYDGKVKPELWRKKITYYLHSKNANMQNLLRWAELQTEPITRAMLIDAVNEVDSLAMLSDDPEVLSYHLWGFLNVNLVDAAWDLFDGVDMENGLEVWRVVNLEMTQKTQSELLALEDAVLTPSRVTEIRDIDKALVAWDAAHRTYLEAGGTSLSKSRQVGAIMRLIPVKVRDQALWEFDKFDGNPTVLRKWIRDRTQWFTKADVGRPGGARAYALDGDGSEASDILSELDLNGADGMADEELCAFVRRKIQQDRRNRPGGTPPRRPAPPRDKRDITCPNCLKKGHTSQECREPKVLAKDRKCFGCGEAGHISSKCPNAKKAQVLTGPAETEDKPVWLGCVYDEGDIPVHRKKMTPLKKAIASAPKPRGCTLGDCMGRAFAQLAELERAEDRAAADVAAASWESSVPAPPTAPADAKGPRATRRPGSGETLDSPLMSCSAKPSPAPCRASCCRPAPGPQPAVDSPEGQWEILRSIALTAKPEEILRPAEHAPGAAAPSPDRASATARTNDQQQAGEHISFDPRAGQNEQSVQGSVRDLRQALMTAQQQAGEHISFDPRAGQNEAARRQAIRESKDRPEAPAVLKPSWKSDLPAVPPQLHNFWGLEAGGELSMAEEEPEFIEVEMTLDTGATVHAADRVDFPGCLVLESPGSRAGQHFQTAGKKSIPNEGQANIELSTNSVEMAMTVQIAKISRPLLSVTRMTESGELEVLCKKDVALILDSKGKTVATFNKKGGLYICMMKYRNPKCKKPEDFPRPHE